MSDQIESFYKPSFLLTTLLSSPFLFSSREFICNAFHTQIKSISTNIYQIFRQMLMLLSRQPRRPLN